MRSKTYSAYLGELSYFKNKPTELDEIEIRALKHGINLNIIFAYNCLVQYPTNTIICKAVAIKLLSIGCCVDTIIEKYKPIYVWSTRLDYDVYLKLFNDFQFMRYPVGISSAFYHFNDMYFNHGFEPDFDLFLASSVSANTDIYSDQLEKAKKLGYFYIHLDKVNESIYDIPKTIDVEKAISLLPNKECKFDPHTFCLTITNNNDEDLVEDDSLFTLSGTEIDVRRFENFVITSLLSHDDILEKLESLEI